MRNTIATTFITLLTLLPSLATAQIEEWGPYDFVTDLGTSYSYAVHVPLNTTDNSPPPAILYLGGTGERYEEGQTETPDRVASFGGPAWRTDRYMNGSRDPADIIAANQFLIIVPMYFEEDQDTMWNTTAVYDVLNNARTHYIWDESRLYLTGFSMGARTAWPMLIADPSYFTAAAIVSGVPVLDVTARDAQINYTGMENLASLPLMHYAGEFDFENASQVWQHQAVQNHLVSLGDMNANFTEVEGAQHGDMQQAAYNISMFEWFLSYQKESTAVESISASLSSAGISASATPTGPRAEAAASNAAINAAAASSVSSANSLESRLALTLGLSLALVLISCIVA